MRTTAEIAENTAVTASQCASRGGAGTPEASWMTVGSPRMSGDHTSNNTPETTAGTRRWFNHRTPATVASAALATQQHHQGGVQPGVEREEQQVVDDGAAGEPGADPDRVAGQQPHSGIASDDEAGQQRQQWDALPAGHRPSPGEERRAGDPLGVVHAGQGRHHDRAG
jgi:hypothetical protein